MGDSGLVRAECNAASVVIVVLVLVVLLLLPEAVVSWMKKVVFPEWPREGGGGVG